MLTLPKTISELDKIISDQVQEDIHLDYKDSRGISDFGKLAKHVSAFANSDGGILIYGIQENDHLPTGRDSGADHKVFNRERIENVILSHISPRIEGLRIAQIPVSESTSIYAIEIPKSFRGPHQQSPDKKYYKRFNFQAVAMEDYEVNDVRNRRIVIPPLIEVGISIRHRVLVHLNVANISDRIAENVTFELPDSVRAWADKENARLFIKGIKYFPPKRAFSFRLGHVPKLLIGRNEGLSKFDVGVSYEHPSLGSRVTESFHINVMDFFGSYTGESEAHELGREIKEAAKKLTDEIAKLNGHISKLSSIAGATGVDLSISTLRNLRHIATGDEALEKLNPTGLSHVVFMEVLGIDWDTAYALSDFFYQGNEIGGLDKVEGMTSEIIEETKKHFILQGA
jgi:Putative DNA-binding domain